MDARRRDGLAAPGAAAARGHRRAPPPTGPGARYGWAAVLRDLGKGREWAGDGQLRINRFDRPTRVLPAGADLSFIPVTSNAGCVGWTEPVRYAIYYPVAGRLAPRDAPRQGGLDRRVGATRAALLRLLEQPLGTTHLAASCGLPVGAVGNHLRVLLDSGVVARRRSGRNVLDWCTALGEALVAADGAYLPDASTGRMLGSYGGGARRQPRMRRQRSLSARSDVEAARRDRGVSRGLLPAWRGQPGGGLSG